MNTNNGNRFVPKVQGLTATKSDTHHVTSKEAPTPKRLVKTSTPEVIDLRTPEFTQKCLAKNYTSEVIDLCTPQAILQRLSYKNCIIPTQCVKNLQDDIIDYNAHSTNPSTLVPNVVDSVSAETNMQMIKKENTKVSPADQCTELVHISKITRAKRDHIENKISQIKRSKRDA